MRCIDIQSTGKLLNGVVLGVLLIGSSLLLSCDGTKNNTPIALYHWRTHFTIGQKEKKLLHQLNSERLYLRFFDIAYDQKEQRPLPIATLQLMPSDSVPILEIVPVVYITNEVFRKTKDSTAIQQLAKATMDKIGRLKNNYLKKERSIKEIQLDCDWTESTKIAYFQFLRALRRQESFHQLEKEAPKGSVLKISATIRLHQIKFREKTGVPPIDKAVVMCYNVGDLTDINESNSILNIGKTATYLTRLDEYPLPFDIALPFFGWGVLYRNEALAGILNQLDQDQLLENFEKTNTTGFYRATADTYIDKTFIYKGDLLRLETVTPENLEALIVLIRDSTKRDYSLILYHINSIELQNQDIDALLDILY